MTDDERTLLLEIAKYCYATGMNQMISAYPLKAAIQKFEPDFDLPSPLMDKPDRPWKAQDGILALLGWKD